MNREVEIKNEHHQITKGLKVEIYNTNKLYNLITFTKNTKGARKKNYMVQK